MKFLSLGSPIKIWFKTLPRIRDCQWTIIEIKLSRNNVEFPQPIFSLIDSGANCSILHQEIAEALGFNLKKLDKNKTVGLSASGKYQSWLLPEPIDLDIYGNLFRLKFTVIENKSLVWPCILGEDSIFEFAKINFQKFKGFFEISFRTDIN